MIESGEVSLYEGKDAKWNEHTFGYDLASETSTLSGSQAMTLDNIFALEDSENKDLNDDGVIGNAIVSTYNIADEDGVLDWGFYRLASGDYITDDNGLTIGLKPTDSQKTLFSRGTTPHTFTTEPTSALEYIENGGGVYYESTYRGVTSWKRDNFNDDHVFKNTETLTFKEILTHEETYNFDINKDGSVGDVVAEVITNDGNGHGLYKTVSGLFVIDDSGLSVGSSTTDPTILTQEVAARRGPPTISNYEFTQTPTGIVVDSDGSSGIYYQDTSGNWFRESFSSTGVFTTKETYSLSQLFADESKYKNDLNNDKYIGGVISSVIADNQNFALYKIASGAFIKDNSGLSIGDASVSPTLLTQEVAARRGPTTINLYEFSNTPTGAVLYPEGGFGVYYQDSGGAWKRDSFDANGLFKQTDSYSFTQLLADESTYNIDLNKDGSVGDVVAEVITNDGNGHGLYKTVSGLFVIDDSGLSVGSSTTDPTILTQEVVARRGPPTIGLKEFDYRPTGIVTNSDGSGGIYYQDTSGNWFRESFSSTGVVTTKETYSLSQLFADESKYKNDLNNDGNVGDVITAVIGDNGSIGLYQTGIRIVFN